MNDASKIKPSHIQRTAFVYIRQSSPAQVEYNRESTARQYALVEKACQLGWAKEQVIVIDEDLGVSGSGFADRSGFARMIAEVALGHVGIVFGLEVSRVARNNADSRFSASRNWTDKALVSPLRSLQHHRHAGRRQRRPLPSRAF